MNLTEDFPREGNLQRPALVGVAWIVDRALDLDSAFESWYFPAVNGRPAVFVRTQQQQIPGGVESVHLEFGVIVAIAVRVDENFEVIVMKDNRVMRRQTALDVWFFEFGGHVEKTVVPEHLGPSAKTRRRLLAPLDIDKIFGPGGPLPGLVIQLAVNPNWPFSAITNVAPGAAHSRLQQFVQGRQSPPPP